ncbi:MAG: DNA polymerase III subunit gamma/tau [Planctomycetota bacterium]|nr:DNA polymerase III subunit gamma/tau [Planctomycetota bacterium]
MAQARRDKEAQAATSYQVVARRFRPDGFEEVVGQDAIQASLKAALSSKRIPHAFLFAGSRGVGKTTTARILARCLNCEKGPTSSPCGKCKLCRSILDGSNPDVVEIDAASNRRIDDMRPLIERIATASMLSRYKVYILDEAHMLTREAFNALLKTLEEPPRGTAFVLATTESHRVPETIRSRCQVLNFRRIGDDDIVRRLRMIVGIEKVELPDAVLEEIAVSCRGSMRDAETALERVLQVAREEGGLELAAYRELVQRIGIDRAIEVAAQLAAGNPAPGLHFCAELERSGVDEREALAEVVEVLRTALLLQVDGPDSGLVTHSGTVREQLQELAKGCDRARLSAMVQAGLLGRERLRRLEDRRAVLELTLIRMAEAGALPALGELVAAARAGQVVVTGPAVGVPGATGAVPAGAPSGAAAPVGDLKAAVLAAAEDQKLLHATLSLCRFDGPGDEDCVTVTLESQRKMHRDRIDSPGLQQQVAGLIEKACGRKVRVAFQGAQDKKPSAKSAGPPPGAAADRVIGRFGGRVVAVDPDDALRPADASGDSSAEGLDEQD